MSSSETAFSCCKGSALLTELLKVSLLWEFYKDFFSNLMSMLSIFWTVHKCILLLLRRMSTLNRIVALRVVILRKFYMNVFHLSIHFMSRVFLAQIYLSHIMCSKFLLLFFSTIS